MSSDYQLEDTLYLPFTTRQFSDGVPTVLAGTPAIDIYEDITATPIITGETLTVSLNSVVGFNMITVTATAATGFEAGKSYTAIIQAGTVGGVSVVGEVVAHFTLDMSAAAKDLANATDGLSALKALIDTIDDFLDTEIAAITAAVITNAQGADVASDVAAMIDGNNRVDVGSWLGTAVTLSSSAPDVNVQSEDNIDFGATKKASINTEVDNALDTAIPASPTGGSINDVLDIQKDAIVEGLAQTGTLNTTTMTTDLSEATDDHYNGRIVIFRGGVLDGQATDITDYSGTNGTITMTAITEAPVNNQAFIIV